MSGATSSLGKKSDGVSMQTHAAMKEAGVGPYEAPPVPPPPPPSIKEQQSQVGSTQLGNPEGLRKALKARGLSEAEIDRKVKGHKQQTGYR